MEVFVKRIVDYLIENECLDSDLSDVYKYHLTSFFEQLLAAICMFIIAVLFNQTVNVCIFLIGFFAIRKRAGGFHFDSFFMCLLVSVIIEICVILIMSCNEASIYMTTIATVLSYFLIMALGVIEHPDIGYEFDEIIASKRETRTMATIILFLCCLLIILHASIETIKYLEAAIILSALLMIIGYVKYNKSVI